MLFVLLTFGPRFCNVPWAALPIGVMILGALHLNFANPPPYGPRYQLTDRLGVETSFPYVGGKAKLFCDDGKGGLQKLLNVSEGPLNPVEMKTGEIELKPSEVDMKYGCPGNLGAFTIGQLHCDLFAIMPNVTCKDGQWCLIGKTGEARCVAKNNKYCFFVQPDPWKKNIETFLPKQRTACVKMGTDGNDDSNFGLCDAQVQNLSIVGLAEAPAECNYLNTLALNNSTLTHEHVILVPSNTKTWQIYFKDPRIEIACEFVSSTKTAFQISKFKESKTFVPKIDNNLPSKIKLTCSIPASRVKYSSISAFIIVYDEDKSNYNLTISKKHNSADNRTFVLQCLCVMPEGMYCIVFWSHDYTFKYAPGQEVITKKLWKKHHDVEHFCFMYVFVINYPNSFSFIEVPVRKNISIILLDPEVIKSEIADKSSDMSKASRSSDGVSKTEKAVNTMAIVFGCLFFVFALMLIVVAVASFYKINKTDKKCDKLAMSKPSSTLMKQDKSNVGSQPGRKSAISQATGKSRQSLGDQKSALATQEQKNQKVLKSGVGKNPKSGASKAGGSGMKSKG